MVGHTRQPMFSRGLTPGVHHCREKASEIGGTSPVRGRGKRRRASHCRNCRKRANHRVGGVGYKAKKSPVSSTPSEGQSMAHRFTIGVEEELQILDPATGELRSHVSQLISQASADIAEQV